MSAPANIPVDSPGQYGVVQDRKDWMLPPGAWTGGKNFRFSENVAEKALGWDEALGNPTGVPVGIFNVPAANDQSYWFVFTLAKAYVWESGAESEVTNTGGDYTTTAAWQWGMTLLSGIPIFNNGVDPPQWWPSVSTTQELEDLTAWPANTTARVIRAFGPYLFAFNLTESSTNRPHKVLVSHKADPGSVPASWDVTDATKDAVSFDLTDAEGGEIFDALPLGSQLIAYKKNSTHTIRFAGGQEIWARDRLFESSGVLCTRCVCRADKGRKHFVVTQNDVIMHGGTSESLQSVVEGVNREAIFAEIDPTNYIQSYVFEDEAEKTLYFCYPTNGNTYPNKAFFFNYEKKTQGFQDWDGSAAAKGVIQTSASDTWASASGTWDSDTDPWSNAGREGILFVSPTNEKIFRHNSGYSFGGTTPVAYLERTGLSIPPRKKEDRADFSSRKIALRLWPKISGSSVWSIRIGAQELRGGTVTWDTVQTFDPSVDRYLDPVTPPSGVLLAIRFEVQADSDAVLEGYDLEVAMLGKL